MMAAPILMMCLVFCYRTLISDRCVLLELDILVLDSLSESEALALIQGVPLNSMLIGLSQLKPQVL